MMVGRLIIARARGEAYFGQFKSFVLKWQKTITPKEALQMRTPCSAAAVLLIMITTNSTSASRKLARSPERDELFINNVSRMALKYELLQLVEIQGLNEEGDEVVATVKEGVDLKTFFKNNKDFGSGLGPAGWTHEGCVSSWKLKQNPSLQVTQFKDGHLELDIDRWYGGLEFSLKHPLLTFKRLRNAGQHLYETGEHRVVKWFTHRMLHTNQHQIKQALDKQKYPKLSRTDSLKESVLFIYLLVYKYAAAYLVELVEQGLFVIGLYGPLRVIFYAT
jgi:hypothetical protein